MVKFARAGLLALVLALSFSYSAATADATAAWNFYAASYNFDSSSGAGLATTFGDAYNGGNFASDAAGITFWVNQAMSGGSPDVSPEELMLARLQNW